MSKVLDKYLNFIKKQKRNSTYIVEKNILSNLEKKYKTLINLDEEDIIEYLESLNLENRTKNTYLAIIKNFYKWLDSHLPVPINEDEMRIILKIKQKIARIREIKRYREEEKLDKKKKFLYEEEIQKVLDCSYSISKKIYSLIYLCLYSGMRKNELRLLRKENIKDDCIVITPEISKTKTIRKIYLDDYTKKLIKKHKDIILNKKIGTTLLNQYLNKIGSILNIKLYPHILRHTYVTHFSKIIQELPSKMEINGKEVILNKNALLRSLVGHHLKESFGVAIITSTKQTTTDIYEHIEDEIVKYVMLNHHFLKKYELKPI